MKDVDLGNLSSNIAMALVLTNVVYLLVTANKQDLILLVRDIAKACERNSLLVEVVVTVASATIFLELAKVIAICISIDTATGEAHIIIEPVNTAYFVHMTFALHVLWALRRIEVEDVD